MLKKLIFLMVFAVLGMGAWWVFFKPSGEVFELEEGYSYLYDGESLEGWRVIGGQSTFEAEGESIVGRHGPGENTFLRTEQTYGDFSLKMQMRWDELGNSGVLFRAQQREADGRAYGYQYELDHAERAWSGGIYDEARRGWLANLEENPEARAAIRLDDWNDVEIEARGPRLKTWINGVPAAEVLDGLDASGFIALQVHSGDIGVMRWRHIRIRELPPLATAGESLAGEEEWRLKQVGDLTFAGDRFRGALLEGESWMTPRRQFDDALVRMTVPACEQATVLRLRNHLGDGSGATFAEVRIYADRAEARLVNQAGETVMEPVELEPADNHDFVGVSLGGALTLTVDGLDVLRVSDAGLFDRGQLLIQPADCADRFEIAGLNWFSLKEKSDEVLFYQTLDTPPAPVLEPEQALAAFSVAPGFEVELVAAEPLVEDPVAMAWDEYGRLYVVEMRGYMPDAYGTGSEEPVGQVVRLEDLDGDGRMDRSEVFLGELVNPRAVAVVNEGILIGEPPNLWLCELPDRDALCEKRRSIGGYATDVTAANVEHMENRLLPGLDNWIYNSKSSRSLRLVDGELQEREGLYRGQWGISKDDYGRLMYNHNSTWLQADLFAAEDLVEAGGGGYPPGLGVNLTEDSQVYSVRVNPGVNRAYLEGTLREDGRLHRATGVSGLAVYRGDQFPEQYRGDVFVPEAAGNVVAQFAISEHGMDLGAEQRLYIDEKWGQRDFLGSTDERFRPVDAMNGPDGALYVIDMYRGIIQDDHFLTDELREQIFQRQLDRPIGKGRIWRVRHTDGRRDRAVPVLAGASGAQLVAALGHINGWVRDTAQRLLLASGDEVRPALENLATADDTLSAIHAIWTLEGREELSRELVLQVAQMNDPGRQVQALRAGRLLLSLEDMETLYASLGEGDEAVRMQLAFSMGEHNEDAAIRDLLRQLLVAGADNPYISQAVLKAVSSREMLFLQELLASTLLTENTTRNGEMLAALAAGAYRSLRGNLGSTELANPALQDLLALVESRAGDSAWQQIAMLEGLQQLVLVDNFQPAMLESPPPIFTDGSISEGDPLWDARLGGRRAFTWPGDELALGLTPLSPEQLQLMAQGEALYPKCAACHGNSGAGTPGLAPPLAGASWVTGPPEWLGRIILQGMTGPVDVNGESWDGVMPPHGHLGELDDATLAGLMTYMRRSWGNKANPVSTEAVAAIREASAGRGKPWTAGELEAVPFDRGYTRFLGKYGISFVTMTIKEEPDGLHMSVPMYGGGLLTPITETLFQGSAGSENVKVEFVVEENGSVNRFILHREGEKLTVKRKSG